MSDVLNNPGYYGADGKTWPWIGQVADDSTWRDNILAGNFKSAKTIPAWGRRVKVRIMGVHDQEQETIPDDQLPWATIEYPTTAGSGGANAFQTVNIRQGMFVTGYFLDGADQNVPVITGVMGQNAQTGMQTQTGMKGGKAFESMSGYAETKEPYPGQTKPKVPEDGVVVDEESEDTAKPAPGAILNKFGLSGTPTPKQLAMIASATADADALGLVGDKLDALISELDKEKRKVSLSIKALEEKQTKEAVKKYGSKDSGGILSDIFDFSKVKTKPKSKK